MDLEQQSPEFLFEQATREMKEGHVIVAHKLLKLAAEKAPDEPKYQAALQVVQRQLDTASPLGDIFDAPAETSGAPAQPDDEAYLVALNAFSQGTDAATAAQAAKKTVDTKSVFDRTVQEALGAAPEATQPKAVKTTQTKSIKKTQTGSKGKKGKGEQIPSKIKLYIQASLLVLLTVGGAVYWYLIGPKNLAYSEYEAILPSITRAIQPSIESEAVLYIDDRDWLTWTPLERRKKMKAVFEVAKKKGVRAVFVYNQQNLQVASADDVAIWVNDPKPINRGK